MKLEVEKFRNEIQKRDIKHLIHFTPTKNLYSILEQRKILSRDSLEKLDIEQFDVLDYIQFTDDIRYDDKRYINLSLSIPNYFLLEKFLRRTNNDPTINWCILKISPKHIYDDNTLFAVTNAASNAAKNQFGITGDFEKFKLMFADTLQYQSSKGIRKLTRVGLKDNMTTDAQAEILVKNEIPYESIIEICFKDESDLASAKAAMSEFDTSTFTIDREIFSK